MSRLPRQVSRGAAPGRGARVGRATPIRSRMQAVVAPRREGIVPRRVAGLDRRAASLGHRGRRRKGSCEVERVSAAGPAPRWPSDGDASPTTVPDTAVASGYWRRTGSIAMSSPSDGLVVRPWAGPDSRSPRPTPHRLSRCSRPLEAAGGPLRRPKVPDVGHVSLRLCVAGVRDALAGSSPIAASDDPPRLAVPGRKLGRDRPGLRRMPRAAPVVAWKVANGGPGHLRLAIAQVEPAAVVDRPMLSTAGSTAVCDRRIPAGRPRSLLTRRPSRAETTRISPSVSSSASAVASYLADTVADRGSIVLALR